MLQCPSIKKSAVAASNSPAKLAQVSASGQSIPKDRLKFFCPANANSRSKPGIPLVLTGKLFSSFVIRVLLRKDAKYPLTYTS